MRDEPKTIHAPRDGCALEITRLHEELAGHLRTSLALAIRIGQLLTEQKAALPHGDFSQWVQEHLPFTDRTARNYMRLYERRDRLETETVSDLSEAYRLLREPKLLPLWEHDLSVAGVVESIAERKQLGARLLDELRAAWAALSDSQWDRYCQDIGIDRASAERSLETGEFDLSGEWKRHRRRREPQDPEDDVAADEQATETTKPKSLSECMQDLDALFADAETQWIRLLPDTDHFLIRRTELKIADDVTFEEWKRAGRVLAQLDALCGRGPDAAGRKPKGRHKAKTRV